MTARREGDEILIEPPFPEAKELGARWDARREAFVLPGTRMAAHMVADAFGTDPGPIAPLGPSSAVLDGVSTAADAALYPWQRPIAARIAAADRGALVVVPPGQGKSLLSIAAADTLYRPAVLVVCPASLTDNWWREIDRWSRPGNATWTVDTWDRASRAARDLPKDREFWDFDVVILDESVMTKSRGAQRFKHLKKVRKHWGRVWLLSGNPTTRHADDLWSQLSLIWPQAYPSYWRFARRYCVVEETPWGDKVVGTRAGRDAMEENGDLVIVVGQEETTQLPEYRFAKPVDVALGPKQREAFDSLAAEFIAELAVGREVVAANEISKLVRLQQIVSAWDGESAKHDALIGLLPTLDGPHLIWTHWREPAALLYERLLDEGVNAAHVMGGMDGTRDAILEDFKAGRIDALILSLGVGKYGHTFTNARTVHYVDRTWNADDYFQSLRRVRRIGLKHRPRVVTYRAPGTTDDLIEMNLEGKLGGISRLTKSDLAELLRGLGKEA